jgi:hypothetical protein
MNTRRAAILIVGAMLASWSTTAMAAYCGLTGSLCGSACVQKCCPECQWKCQKVMKKCTYTTWEPVTETCQKTVYDTVYEDRTVTKVHRISEIQYRDESFTYTRPVCTSHTREVPYTVQIPIYETQTREVAYVTHVPSYETLKRSIPYTTYRTVYDTHQRSVQYCVPRTVQYTQTISVPCGHWETHVEEHPGRTICEYVQQPGCWVDSCCGDHGDNCQKGCSQKGSCVYRPGKCCIVQRQCPPIRCCKRVWVPRYEQRTIDCTKTVYDWHTRVVPYTVARSIAETHTYEQEYTVCRLTAVRQTQLVEYPVVRMMSEQRTRTVSYDVTTAVQEIGSRRVPFAVHRDIPSTCVVREPRQVPRQVSYTVTRCVPRTHVKEIPVYIYTPVPSCCPSCPCGPECQKSCDATAADAEAALTEIEAAKQSAEVEVIPASATVRAASIKIETIDDAASDPLAASRHFAAGLEKYRDGLYDEAVKLFSAATEAAPTDAKYAYFHALALYSAGKKTEAEAAVANAAELEDAAPVANWGRAMERVQGEARIWVEAARQKLRAT